MTNKTMNAIKPTGKKQLMLESVKRIGGYANE